VIRTIAVSVAVAALTLAACGGEDDTAPAATDAAPATTDAAPAATDPAPAATDGTAEITIAGFAFDGVTEIAVGTTVTVTNTDSSPHTWTADDGSFDSGSIAGGESFEFTFDTPGEFAYHCNFHPSMTGTITVSG
jgi:plastocyanin